MSSNHLYTPSRKKHVFLLLTPSRTSPIFVVHHQTNVGLESQPELDWYHILHILAYGFIENFETKATLVLGKF
jgi:hypothetical protein